MSIKTVDISEVQSQLNELLDLTMQGTEIVFARGETPLARLVPIAKRSTKPRIAGLHKGAILMSDDFDEPLPDDFWLGGK
jgi:antitoxin (DNA-binding transcriptional repressor) of toxin-antitoxin stability system